MASAACAGQVANDDPDPHMTVLALRNCRRKELQLTFNLGTSRSHDDLSDPHVPNALQVKAKSRRASGPTRLQHTWSRGLDRGGVTIGDCDEMAFVD
jgi:hypothetical protein